MKSTSDRSLLDDFIRETLKSSDEHYPPIDWNELDVLLKHDQRSIPVEINKKNLILVGSVAAALLLLFVIFRVADHYSSLPDDTEPVQDSSHQVLLPSDSLTSGTGLNPDSMLTDTLSVSLLNDTAGSSKLNVSADTAVYKTPISPAQLTAPAVPKKEKKKRTDTLPVQPVVDSALPVKEPAPDEINPFVAPAVKEDKTETLPVSDTTTKAPAPGNTKKKKAKTKNTSSPPAATQTDTPVAQPDSLK